MTPNKSVENADSEIETAIPGTCDSGWTACWKQRTLPEKLLLSAISIIFIGFFVAMIVLVEIYLRLEDRLLTAGNKSFVVTDDVIPAGSLIGNLTREPSMCVTLECVEASARILTALDTKADPCDDMAQFACGGWLERQARTPGGKDVVLVLENLQASVDHQLKLMLESPTKPDEIKANDKVRGYFASCMADRQDQVRHASVKKAVDELGIIAAPSEWDPAQWDLTELIGKILNVNGAPLFDLVVQVDDRNTSRYVLSVTLPRQSGIVPQFHSPVPRDLLHHLDILRDKKERHRVKRQFLGMGDVQLDNHDEFPDFAIFESLNHPDPSLELHNPFLPDANFLQSIQQLSRDARASAAFRLMQDLGAFNSFSVASDYRKEESDIRRVISSVDQLLPSDRDRKLKQQSSKILNYYTVDLLQQNFGFINWPVLLRKTLGKNVPMDTTVVVHYPDILHQIQAIVNVTDPRIMHNTLLMLVVRDLALELFKAPPGMDKWSFCIQAVKGGFGEVLSGIYLQYFTPAQLENYRVKAEEMFVALKESVIEMIQQSSWPDSITKVKALSKARNLKPNLVAPSIFFNQTFLESMAAQVNIDGLDFVASTWQMYRLFRRDFFDIYSKPVDETTVTWQMLAYPMIANAFYLQHFNSMVLPLGLLHDPLFSLDTPNYLGLGTLGFIVAHEIMHGFDNSGVEFDEDGVRRNLLSPSSQQLFQQKMKCVSNQFSNAFRTEYSINGTSIVLKVDGELTLNENVADLGAIKAIVATQTRMARERGPAPNLPGLNYTHEQIMLINAAQAYCALITPQAYALILGMDEHAPPHDRVNGFMMNLPDYGRIFNCPAGTRLNPKSKCSVW